VADNSISGGATALSEFNSSTGIIVGEVKNTIHQSISDPSCIAVAGDNIWVSDASGNGAYEYNASTGAYIRETSTSPVTASGVGCVSYHSGYIWITSDATNNVIEYNASTGAYERDISVVNPDQVIFTGNELFIVSAYPTDSVLEYSQFGVFMRTVEKANLGYLRPLGMAILYDGVSLWVANTASNSVTVHPL